MLEVAWLFEYPTLNGGEYSLLSMFEGLRANDFYVRAIAPVDGPLSAALAARRIDIVPFGETRGAEGPSPAANDPSAMRDELAAILRRLRPKLLHANSLKMGRLSGPVAESLRLPSIAHLRDIARLSAGSIDDLNRHTRLLAVSHATCDYHVAQGLSADKTAVLYNGVDLARFRPRPADGWLRNELNLPRDAVLIGNVGQLVMRKGQDTLAEAAAELARRLPRAHFLLIGERYSRKDEAVEYERRVRAMFRAPGLDGRVHFLGVRHDVDLMLPELDVLAHAARQEPLGRVLLEGAACGAAIVATQVGGTAEIFPEVAHAAILIPPDDPSRLAAAIERLCRDEALRRELGAAARRRAVEAFDATIAAEGLVAHYREAIGAKTARATR